MYSDAHVHLDERMKEILKDESINAVISCSTPKQCTEAMTFIAHHPQKHMSCGIHPWQADTTTWEEMLPWLEKTRIIGEIGMDCVWCDCDLHLQKNIFERQLAYAHHYQKPVVLHTKGMEKEILEQIKHYPNKYQVHWYSCEKYIEAYRSLDCYFSIGPFPSIDPNVHKVVEMIPLDRLMIETDGISAVEWAMNHPLENDAYLSSLQRIAEEIAKIKNREPKEILMIAKHNLLQFIS